MFQFDTDDEDDKTKLARQTNEDCEAFYFAEDLSTRMPCILPAGHQGLHIDPTGVEFKCR